MKYIKFLIILFVIIIITISILLFSGILKNNKNNVVNSNINNAQMSDGNTSFLNNIKNDIYQTEIAPEDEDIDVEITNNKFAYVENKSDYFTIKELYNNYINLIGNKKSAELISILSPSYINKYNIKDANIVNALQIPIVDNSIQKYKTNITEILWLQTDYTTYVYIVKGKCRIDGTNTIFPMQAMFEIDILNKVYYIYPYQYMQDLGIDKLGIGDTLNLHKTEEIKANYYNKFEYITKTDVEMANEYFSHYSELIKYYKDEAFEKLNSEYMQKRFGNKEAFQNHLKENSKVLDNMKIDKYKVYSTKDYTDYICTDQYDNLYIFRQQGGTMRYTVFLDNYTIILPEYSEQYNELEKYDKAKYNVFKFTNMLNTKDYNAIYNCLDITFRTNNFKTVNELKEYLKNNLYNLNVIEIKDYDVESYEYCIFVCTMANMDNVEEYKVINIIIDQTEGTEFTMSFSFEQ